jgi:hypothetical protein
MNPFKYLKRQVFPDIHLNDRDSLSS